MTLDDVLSEWEEDSKINKFDLGDSSIKTPMLHSKYLKLLMEFKRKLKAAEFDQSILLKDKFLYYEGKMDSTTLQKVHTEQNWKLDPFDGLTILKTDLKYYYNADTEIQKSEKLISYYKMVIETIEDILDVIKWRHQTIKNIIDWRKFEAGN